MREHVATFHHIDGMYSLCTIDDWETDNSFHMSAMQPLVKVGEFYQVDAAGGEDDLPTEDQKKGLV